ncbi:MAG: hypothetical protein HC785_16320 [Calothrix sp. CSU_2_0]|nr:hypothetical protein [Calothrix sp. CSU_2_0]
MRPQLNLALDDYPELPEKLKKYCKYKGYKLSEFCARILNAAVEEGIAEISNFETTEQRLNRIESELGKLEELRSRVAELESEIKNLVQREFLREEVKIKVEDEGLSRLRCLECGQVGGHKKSGFNRQGKQLYYCGNPDHKTSEGGKYRSHKFEFQ